MCVDNIDNNAGGDITDQTPATQGPDVLCWARPGLIQGVSDDVDSGMWLLFFQAIQAFHVNTFLTLEHVYAYLVICFS